MSNNILIGRKDDLKLPDKYLLLQDYINGNPNELLAKQMKNILMDTGQVIHEMNLILEGMAEAKGKVKN